MSTREYSPSDAILGALLNKGSPQERAHLMRYLTDEKQSVIASLKLFKDPTRGFESLSSTLSRIHPSWIAPVLRSMPEGEIRLFISALDEQTSQSVKNLLRFSGEKTKLTEIGKLYLQKILYQKIATTSLLPIECLPESPLNSLIDLRSADLIALTDFLGLHDLAIEMRQIVDKRKLSLIQESLSPSEKAYLSILVQSRESVTFTRMGLLNWQGDKEVLKQLIQQRGVNRLAKALSLQNSSLVWYVVHKMDSERGLLLMKLAVPLEKSQAAEILGAQVVELISYMRSQHA
jgi:hypothetical protein